MLNGRDIYFCSKQNNRDTILLPKAKKKKTQNTRYIKSVFIKVLEIKQQKTLVPQRLE